MSEIFASILMLIGFGTAEPIEARISRVVDGDTVVVTSNQRQRKVRILWIDTPEIKGRCQQEINLAFRAKNQAKTFLPVGAKITLTTTEPEWTSDKYGRLLANIIMPNGKYFGKEMLRLGLAKPWPPKGNWCGGRK